MCVGVYGDRGEESGAASNAAGVRHLCTLAGRLRLRRMLSLGLLLQKSTTSANTMCAREPTRPRTWHSNATGDERTRHVGATGAVHAHAHITVHSPIHTPQHACGRPRPQPHVGFAPVHQAINHRRQQHVHFMTKLASMLTPRCVMHSPQLASAQSRPRREHVRSPPAQRASASMHAQSGPKGVGVACCGLEAQGGHDTGPPGGGRATQQGHIHSAEEEHDGTGIMGSDAHVKQETTEVVSGLTYSRGPTARTSARVRPASASATRFNRASA
jgi:hypothetical protein